LKNGFHGFLLGFPQRSTPPSSTTSSRAERRAETLTEASRAVALEQITSARPVIGGLDFLFFFGNLTGKNIGENRRKNGENGDLSVKVCKVGVFH